MSIIFNDIPDSAQLNLTGIELTKEKLTTSLFSLTQRIGVIGQCDPSLIASGDNGKPIQVFSAEKVAELCGVGYQIHKMAEKVFLNCGASEVFVFPIRLASGDAAESTLTVTAVPTTAGTLAIYISGVRIPVTLTTGLSVTQVAEAIVAAINAETSLPCTAANTLGVVTITVKWYGTSGNDLQIDLNISPTDSSPAGLVITETDPSFTGGTGDIDISPALNNVAESAIYTVFSHPIPPSDTTNIALIEAFEDVRWHYRVCRGFIAIGSARGEYTTPLTTQIAARNSFVSSFVGQQNIYESQAEVSAAVCGAVAKSAGTDPSLQFHSLIVKGLTVPYDESSHWTHSTRETAVQNGLGVLDFVGGNVVIDQLVNTYTLTSGGAVAPKVDRFVNTVLTLAAIVYDRQQYFLTIWSRAKVAPDGGIFPPGQKIMTPNTLKMELLARYRLYQDRGWVINPDDYKLTIVTEINSSNSQRIDSQDQLILIGNLRVTAMKMAYDFAA